MGPRERAEQHGERGPNLQFPDAGTQCTPSVTLADPGLGPLADNGGPTWTMAIAAGSPAVGSAFGDLASSTVAGFPLVDVLLIAGAGVGLWYVSKHRKKGGKK